MEAIIKELKKHDHFFFNDYEYRVKKKYRNDNSPLIALKMYSFEDELFYNEDLIIRKI